MDLPKYLPKYLPQMRSIPRYLSTSPYTIHGGTEGYLSIHSSMHLYYIHCSPSVLSMRREHTQCSDLHGEVHDATSDVMCISTTHVSIYLSTSDVGSDPISCYSQQYSQQYTQQQYQLKLCMYSYTQQQCVHACQHSTLPVNTQQYSCDLMCQQLLILAPRISGALYLSISISGCQQQCYAMQQYRCSSSVVLVYTQQYMQCTLHLCTYVEHVQQSSSVSMLGVTPSRYLRMLGSTHLMLVVISQYSLQYIMQQLTLVLCILLHVVCQ